MSRGLRILFYILNFSVFAVMIACEMISISNGKQISIGLLIVIIYIWLSLCWGLIGFLSYRKTHKIMKLLYNCQVQEFLKKYIPLVEQAKQITAKQIRLFNLSTGYLEIGHDAYAKLVFDQLAQIGPVSSWRVTPIFQIFYANNLFTYHLRMNELGKAASEIQMTKWVLDNKRMNEKHREKGLQTYKTQVYLLQMANGNFEGAEEFFEEIVSKAENLWGKVIAYNILGLVYKHNGKTEEARATFTYAIENGGDTRYVGEAKFQLEQMEKELVDSLIIADHA